MPSYGSRELTSEELAERALEKRVAYVKDMENFMTFFILSFTKLQKLTRKEKMIAIEYHEILKSGMTMGKLWEGTKEEFYQTSWKEKFKGIMVLPAVYVLVTLSNRNATKFKNENLELYL